MGVMDVGYNKVTDFHETPNKAWKDLRAERKNEGMTMIRLVTSKS